jgi:3-hydroxybutyryl-CoA dehydrogenase
MAERVAVVGAGQMGNGIAHTFALNGFPVTLIDVSTDALARARSTIAGNLDRQVKKGVIEAGAKEPALARITDATDVSAASEAALVIEAASEDPALKFRLFAALDEVVGPQTILATNTSSISITEIAGRTRRPQRVIGMHFMNPVPMMALVEVIRGLATSDATTATVTALAKQVGKTPVEVNDYPGFVANRILMPMINEAAYCVMEGVAAPEAIDTVMKLGMNHPLVRWHSLISSDWTPAWRSSTCCSKDSVTRSTGPVRSCGNTWRRVGSAGRAGAGFTRTTDGAAP